MKKKNSIAKFSIKKNTVAKLNDQKAVSVVGGATGTDYLACHSPSKNFNNTRSCDVGARTSYYGMCNGPYATIGCAN